MSAFNYYFWKNQRVHVVNMGDLTDETIAEYLSCPACDTSNEDDKLRWGLWTSDPGTGIPTMSEFEWVGGGYEAMPKEFRAALLIMGVEAWAC